MKDIKLSFPYPSTSRHNLSQSIGTSASMGLVIPARVVEVLSGDSHRIRTSFSLISNPLVKPLLQGINLRYCRFWVPRRIYHIDQRANNSDYDPVNAPVRHGSHINFYFPAYYHDSKLVQLSNFGQSSFFDYIQMASSESNFTTVNSPSVLPTIPLAINTSTTSNVASTYKVLTFNAEPYLGYIDICRNYFSDSATNTIAFSWMCSDSRIHAVISPLSNLDSFIDHIQNNRGEVGPFDLTDNYQSGSANYFKSFVLPGQSAFSTLTPISLSSSLGFGPEFRTPHSCLCIPSNRPDRLSRLFDTRPLTSQNASIQPSEITIGNLSFLEKLQRFLTRRFFGGSRYTDIMYSVFGQKVPHVDSPVLLDVFDFELGSELVASTNATESQNPGVLGGFMSSSGVFSSRNGRENMRYSFNETGYLIDLYYIMPRLYRTSFYPDYYPVSQGGLSSSKDTPMMQANFIPDFNGIGWQQPAFAAQYLQFTFASGSSTVVVSNIPGFCCEPSWQQFRTLPDVCTGALNPLRFVPGTELQNGLGPISSTQTVNSPLFAFNDRMTPYNIAYDFITATGDVIDTSNLSRLLRSRLAYSDFNELNSVFGSNTLLTDNIFIVFNYAHRAKRQVSKRFTLSF